MLCLSAAIGKTFDAYAITREMRNFAQLLAIKRKRATRMTWPPGSRLDAGSSGAHGAQLQVGDADREVKPRLAADRNGLQGDRPVRAADAARWLRARRRRSPRPSRRHSSPASAPRTSATAERRRPRASCRLSSRRCRGRTCGSCPHSVSLTAAHVGEGAGHGLLRGHDHADAARYVAGQSVPHLGGDFGRAPAACAGPARQVAASAASERALITWWSPETVQVQAQPMKGRRVPFAGSRDAIPGQPTPIIPGPRSGARPHTRHRSRNDRNRSALPGT